MFYTYVFTTLSFKKVIHVLYLKHAFWNATPAQAVYVPMFVDSV